MEIQRIKSENYVKESSAAGLISNEEKIWLSD